MELDMYLYLSKYSSKFDRDENKEGFYPEALQTFQEKQLKHNFFLSKEEKYQVGYWRKANAIHKFFVNKCAQGEDNCRPVYVNLKDLKDLKALCKKVLADHSKAKDLLPTQEGFFFGSQEYDEWYFQDLKYTVELLTDVITFMANHSKDNDYWDCYYEASW